MRVNDIMRANVSREDILNAISHAIEQGDFLDNLRDRKRIVRLDSRVRGYLGEICIRKFLEANHIDVINTNVIGDMYSCDVDIQVRTVAGLVSGEVKTSNLPAIPARALPDLYRTFQKIIYNCDIKIINKTAFTNPDHMDIDRDFYAQIYFMTPTAARDNHLNELYERYNAIIPRDVERIYEMYEYSIYLDNTYFVAWDDKDSIMNRLSAMPADKRKYHIANRWFWKCNIGQSKAPALLIDFLNSDIFV